MHVRGTVFLNGLAPDDGAVVRLSARAVVLDQVPPLPGPFPVEPPFEVRPLRPELLATRASALSSTALRPAALTLRPEVGDLIRPPIGELPDEPLPRPFPRPVPEPQPVPREREVPVGEVADVPLTVTVPAGQQRGEFEIRTKRVQRETILRVTATYEGASRGDTVIVLPAVTAVRLEAVVVESPVRVGFAAPGSVRLSGPAPAGGALVDLTSSEPLAARPDPPQVIVPAGALTARFAVRALRADEERRVTITAVRAGESRTAELVVQPAPSLPPLVLSALELIPERVRGGLTANAQLTLSRAAPAPEGARVELSTSDENVASFRQPFAVVAAGQQQLMVPIFTRRVPSEDDTEVEIRAMLGTTHVRTLLVGGTIIVDPPPRDCEILQPRIPELEVQIRGLEEELRTATETRIARLGELESTAASLRQQLTARESEVAGQVATRDQEATRLEQELAVRRERAIAEIGGLERRIADLDVAVADEARLSSAISGLEASREPVEPTSFSALNLEINAEIAALRREREGLLEAPAELSSLRTEVGALRERLQQDESEARATIDDLRAQIARTQEEFGRERTALTGRIAESEGEASRIRAELARTEAELGGRVAAARAEVDQVRARLIQLDCPPLPAVVRVPLPEITGGLTVPGRVEISVPAPPDGHDVVLETDRPGVVDLPDGPIRIAPGETVAEFPIRVSDTVSTRTAVDIRVPDTEVATPITVVPAADVAAERVEIDRRVLVPGGAATATVTLNAPAPANGAEVRVESGDESVVRVPTTVTVPAGETSVSFPVEVATTISQPTTVDLRSSFRTDVSTPIMATPTIGLIR